MTRRVAVLVPCRDEGPVLERKIRNTLALEFPGPGGHLLLVVDDHSRDGAVERAFAAAVEGATNGSVQAKLLRSSGPPGKGGALAAGLDAVREFDAVLVTDADVLLDRGALVRLVERLDEPGVGVVTGEQRFVARIEGERAEGSGDTLYDRFTRAVRRRESKRGSVFSVHGECVVLRPSDGLRPEIGIASDDLDLGLSARLRGLRVAYADGARFFEARPSTRAARHAQALRRARSFVQFVVRRRGALVDRRLPWRDRFALLAYFALAILAPIAAVGLLVVCALLLSAGGLAARLAVLGFALLSLALPPLRDAWARAVLLGRAFLEYAFGVRASDRWEPRR